MIPVTSKATKFKEILNKKIKRYGICDTIVIGKLLGRECAFLIQNMFPITKYYIEKEYIQASNNVPVAIEDPLANEIIIKQKKVLSLVRAGYTNLVFPNVLSIEQKLKEEISNNNVEIASDIH